MAADVLVVDDEADIRELVAGILSDEGYAVRTANDSESALAAIRAYATSQQRDERKVVNWSHRMLEMFRDRAADRLPRGAVEKAAADVAARKIDPYTVVESWLKGNA